MGFWSELGKFAKSVANDPAAWFVYGENDAKAGRVRLTEVQRQEFQSDEHANAYDRGYNQGLASKDRR